MISLLAKTLANLASTRSPGPRFLVLSHHRVLPQSDAMLPDVPSAAEFENLLRCLRRSFNVFALAEALVRVDEGTLPSRSVVLTFDDGYADNFGVALPILERYGLTATFFVTTGFMDQTMMWNDRVIETVRLFAGGLLRLDWLGLGDLMVETTAEKRIAAEQIINAVKYLTPPERTRNVERLVDQTECPPTGRLMMTPDELTRLQEAGMEIGGHTVTHPILARLDPAEALSEIQDNKVTLERIVGAPITSFAYPNGKPGVDYAPQHVEQVKTSGYTAAVSTRWACVTAGTDRYQIPRVGLTAGSELATAARLIRYYFD